MKLPWRASECLQALLDAEGDVVPREELEQAIWGGTVVEESNLAQCIATLRRALDPAPGGGSHIETVARVGYRIAVRVEQEPAGQDSDRNSQPAPTAQTRNAAPHPEGPARTPVRPLWILASATGLFLLAGTPIAMLEFHRWQRAERIDVLLAEGFDLCRGGNLADIDEASGKFRLALKLDPRNALAMSGLAEAGARSGKSDGIQAATELARRAVARAPECAECHAILGWILMTFGWQWAEAELALGKAMDPPDPPAQALISRIAWLASRNRLPETLPLARRLVSGHPHLAQGRLALAMAHFFSGQYRHAIEQSRQALVIQPRQSAAYYWMSRSAMQLGDDSAALEARAMEIITWRGLDAAARAPLLARFRVSYGRGGRAALVRAWIEDAGADLATGAHCYDRAVWHAWSGNHAAALDELEAGLRSRPPHMIYAAVDPAFEPIRNEPRFRAVLRGIGLQ
ncbi:MAG: winged helix-turn-helix domain-containing protein [Bryobacteraceae bacterium]|nr:winged helix-turn-helix domain-containing protein [Bryobacteraceae bacterium]